MAPLLDKMVSREQSSFIYGRSIVDNISIAQEMVHNIHKKVRGGNMLMKIDMAIAYDKVNWRFLLVSLQRLGFSNQWQSLVFNCISSPCYSIMLNGTTRGFFKPFKGLRQGDRLSPYLFIVAQEVLSRMINQAFVNKQIQHFHSEGMVISHLFYADDLLIFANGNKKSTSHLLELVNSFKLRSVKW